MPPHHYIFCILENEAKGRYTLWAKSRDLVMVTILESHLNAVPWVLGKLFYVVTGPQT